MIDEGYSLYRQILMYDDRLWQKMTVWRLVGSRHHTPDYGIIVRIPAPPPQISLRETGEFRNTV